MGERAALYLRLSKEDLNKLEHGDESASIVNQRMLLLQYAGEQNFTVVEIYSDEDESGLYEDRPEFERLIQDSRTGKFDVVIAKSQSRFSRNMEHVEKYLHHDFVLQHIRFIGVADHADTNNRGNKKARQINSLVNEWYCEDLSESIRSVFKVKMQEGQFLGASAPYGYQKEAGNHNHLVIDPYAAAIVRRIYKLYISGLGKGKIASLLSKEGVLIPTRYKQQILQVPYENNNLKRETKGWSYQTIHMILNNETYTGSMVQNRANKISYKDRKVKALPREQWIVVRDTQEAIIERPVWELVQKIQRQKARSLPEAEKEDLCAGMLFCKNCQKAMRRSYRNRKGKNSEISGYVCSTYKTLGKAFCSSHKVEREQIEQILWSAILKERGRKGRWNDTDENLKMLPERTVIRMLFSRIEVTEKGFIELYFTFAK